MHRFLIALVLSFVFFGLVRESNAQRIIDVSGYLTPGQTRIFYSRTPSNSNTDTIYRISGNYSISGKLIIQEGAEVHFLPGGRIVDSTGGKIIANGFAGLQRRIQIRGENVNANSYEWGHIVVLPGADSVFFANTRFAFFRKKESIDNQLYYGVANLPGNPLLTNSLAIMRQSNGTGGVMTTFSGKTYLYDVIVDSCQAIYRGGAFAFLQAPTSSYFPSDDGRLALVNHQVRKLLIRDTRVYNETTVPNSHLNWADTGAYGGAIYIAAKPDGASIDWRQCFLGYADSNAFPIGIPANLPGTNDSMQFERCTTNLASDTTANGQQSYGGAIYVGNYSSLWTALIGCNTDSANSPYNRNVTNLDQNTRGGAIYVSKTSSNPNWQQPPNSFSPSAYNTRLAGLAIIKRARFLGNVAGMGGAIYMDWLNNGGTGVGASGNGLQNGSSLVIDGENIIQNSPFTLRDSGNIEFNSNTAYSEGGAIYQNWYTFITGYLAPSTKLQPRFDSVEMRVKFVNNAAGLAGGSIYLNPKGNPDLQSRRVWHIANYVDPSDSRIQRPAYYQTVLGGGAEFLGTRDSAFAVEYFRNYVRGGNGGAVYMNMGQSAVGTYAYNRFMVEDKYVAQTPTLSPLPYDKRELTRFIENSATVAVQASDSVGLENRNGRGGALFVNINNGLNPMVLLDTLILSRVRFEHNEAFTGSAIHSDNYRLQLTANQTLIANNIATSQHVDTVNLETPNMNSPGDPSAGATIWGDFEGPAPQHETNSRGNAIYDNAARYILREPDGPHGFGGVDTLRGNFWGNTGPDLITQLPTLPIGPIQATFFVGALNGCFTNVYEPNRAPSSAYNYTPIGTIPDTLLMEGRIYDIFDKGLDIKTVDYSNRRLAIAEAFSLGLPTDIGTASNNHTGIHRWTRDIFEKDPVYLSKIIQYQTQFVGPHPLGYPLFLTADVDATDLNRDPYARNYTTVFVLNETTQEYVRVNLKEEFPDHADSATIPYRGRLDFVPDSTVGSRNPIGRASIFWSPALIRPSNGSYLEIARAAKLEDSAALAGRAYTLDQTQLQNVVGPDTIATIGLNGTPSTLWYAGERYHTLPVRPGDVIAVFSRTQLWKYGFAGAKARGLEFPIGDVLPPNWTTDVQNLMADTLNPNRLYVREDKPYQAYSQGQNLNNVMFRIGGYDLNQFYDPRFLWNPYYTMLDYSVTFAGMDSANYRLPWWVMRDTVHNVNPTVGSNGYIQLFGTPHNSDVVPGGEPVHVVMTNWPPNKRSEHLLLDSLKAAGTPPPYNQHSPSDLGSDSLKLSMWIYNPPFLNCNVAGGFLSDTIDIRRSASVYDFRIFVQDSLPVFTSAPQTGNCTTASANLTDSLRYDFDVQTDDELEDSTTQSVTTAAGIPWDFRYGRTSYSGYVVPSWLRGAFNAPNFKTKGIIHVLIDSGTAKAMLTPVPQVNGELSLDTIVAIMADDGHAGRTIYQWHATINVAPQILTTTLPNAKEDSDYSHNTKDTSVVRTIQAFDPNYGDNLTYQLLYQGQTQDVYVDSRYKTGKVTLHGTTPTWLTINPVNGQLSGVPGIADAPRSATSPCGQDTVTIIVTDCGGLQVWRQIPLDVDSTEHPVNFLRGPRTICIQNNTQFCDSILVHDHDLLRPCAGDTLTYTIVPSTSGSFSDSAFTVTPSKSIAPLGSDTTYVNVCGTFHVDPGSFNNGPVTGTVSVAVTDGHGNYDTLTYKVYVGDVPTFECAVYVSNKVDTQAHPVADVQRLCFGAGQNATDSLDIKFCEFEVPSAPNAQVFDARWEYPIGGSLKGGYIDIRDDTTQTGTVTWQIRFNAGSDNGGYYYPIQICWRPSCITSANSTKFKGSFYLRHPFNPSEFSINMATGQGPIDNGLYTLTKNVGGSNDSDCLSINDVGLTNALIVFEGAKYDVAPSTTPVFALEPNVPNPFTSSTTVRFSVAERSNVRIEIYDIKGTLIRVLTNQAYDMGSHSIVWDGLDAGGSDVSAGTYIAKMTAGNFSATTKMTLSK